MWVWLVGFGFDWLGFCLFGFILIAWLVLWEFVRFCGGGWFFFGGLGAGFDFVSFACDLLGTFYTVSMPIKLYCCKQTSF